MCDMSHLYVWHDSFTCVTWLIHMCNMTHSYVWHNSSYVWHDSFFEWQGSFHLWHVSSYEWHDSFQCLILWLTWLILRWICLILCVTWLVLWVTCLILCVTWLVLWVTCLILCVTALSRQLLDDLVRTKWRDATNETGVSTDLEVTPKPQNHTKMVFIKKNEECHQRKRSLHRSTSKD